MAKTPITDFDFYLPEHLIAQYPAERRDESRLLVYDRGTGEIKDKIFKEIVSEISPNDFLVINNTKVLRARLYGRKKTGGKVEILILNVTGDYACEAMTKGNIKCGDEIFFDDYVGKIVEIRENGIRIIEFSANIFEIMDSIGHVPLPPYVKRSDEQIDRERYQTVYSCKPGSVAAPTAGLHFTNELMEKLTTAGVNIVEITLNVGAGTFRPVKEVFLEDHVMHSESFSISENAFKQINEMKQKGKKLIAVGTTTLRALESLAHNGQLTDYGNKTTDIFIRPGFKFNIVDKLITNFHLPKSTLFVLMAAFCGLEEIKNVYKYAVEKEYRFFSYGDAMFIK